MFYYLGITALCFFAAVGICSVIRSICDFLVSRKMQVISYVVIESSPGVKDTEHAIRLFESCIMRKHFFGSVCYLKLACGVPYDKADLEKLSEEFKNIII